MLNFKMLKHFAKLSQCQISNCMKANKLAQLSMSNLRYISIQFSDGDLIEPNERIQSKCFQSKVNYLKILQ